MKRGRFFFSILLVGTLMLSGLLIFQLQFKNTIESPDQEIISLGTRSIGSFSNATVVSDDATHWNDGSSYRPSIAIDGSGIVHVVWYDYTDGAWGTDTEIMYANLTASGWSNATVVSDDATHWNDGISRDPFLAIDGSGTVHVVWRDETDGAWGTDTEIMYANLTASGWSNATVVSDDATHWNDGISRDPSLAIDGSGTVHVVWYDETDGAWGTDTEIMYANLTASGWSNATVVSDDATHWNDDGSNYPSIAVDGSGTVHVVWRDETDGAWGSDSEIMYVYSIPISTSPPSSPPIPGFELIFILTTLSFIIVLYVVIRLKQKVPNKII